MIQIEDQNFEDTVALRDWAWERKNVPPRACIEKQIAALMARRTSVTEDAIVFRPSSRTQGGAPTVPTAEQNGKVDAEGQSCLAILAAEPRIAGRRPILDDESDLVGRAQDGDRRRIVARPGACQRRRGLGQRPVMAE